MKIKHPFLKGHRIYNSTYKPRKGQTGFNKRFHRIPFYNELTICDSNCHLWWSEPLKKWLPIEECEATYCTHMSGVYSIKAAMRHIRKHIEIPKGTTLCLCSPLSGCDVYITK